MVGSPFQTPGGPWPGPAVFVEEFSPGDWWGIGPFFRQRETPFPGLPLRAAVELTLYLLSLLSAHPLLLPDVLLPATTALGTLLADGRERGDARTGPTW